MLSNDGGFETTTALPHGHDLQPPGLHAFHHVISQPIGNSLVVNTFLSEGLAIHLEALELDTTVSWFIAEQNLTKIRVASLGTHTGEFLMEVFDDIRGITRIWERLKQGGIRHPNMVRKGVQFNVLSLKRHRPPLCRGGQ